MGSKLYQKFKKLKVSHLTPEKRAKVVCFYLTKLCELDSVGISSATRLLTLTRPDLAFSYNGGSVRKLNLLGKLKGDYPTVKNYQKLLRLFYSTEWYNSKPPKAQTKERQIWNHIAGGKHRHGRNTKHKHRLRKRQKDLVPFVIYR